MKISSVKPFKCPIVNELRLCCSHLKANTRETVLGGKEKLLYSGGWQPGEKVNSGLKTNSKQCCYLSDISGPLEKALEVRGLKTLPWGVWGELGVKKTPPATRHWADSQGAPRLTSGVPAKLWSNLLHVNTTGKAGFALECCFPPSFCPQPGTKAGPDPLPRSHAQGGSHARQRLAGCAWGSQRRLALYRQWTAGHGPHRGEGIFGNNPSPSEPKPAFLSCILQRLALESRVTSQKANVFHHADKKKITSLAPGSVLLPAESLAGLCTEVD